mmetsp:Transcript_13876/g.31247  ORF Transcript_13876/g.31247 Transcript_13876/m.31247 type:complete len:161 (-) Transcript_13876:229-711(-)|eukprot:CAMPEP_0204367966 /NCGR_PEP_ID=MMETSP0469-20131031/43834_1 /ASSEMBLY_ACC=CAM_ASM_000384 /TAXON_ID=2969 /ORGANISM="Oxyrrhis marina" /LENGTH=160 /DNA_ID=CAMNT_0051357451 /DNA_START=42 /DNA_END=524 /DNA_ORIENTATION=-
MTHRGTAGRRSPQQESGLEFFKGARVNSSAGFIMSGGTILALPHPRRSQSSTPTGRSKFRASSEYMDQFKETPYCYCSMDQKPLSSYNALSYRSRNAIPDVPMPYKNASIVQFDGGLHVLKNRQFSTTHKVNHTGEPCEVVSNQGILSEKSKFRKHQIAK